MPSFRPPPLGWKMSLDSHAQSSPPRPADHGVLPEMKRQVHVFHYLCGIFVMLSLYIHLNISFQPLTLTGKKESPAGNPIYLYYSFPSASAKAFPRQRRCFLCIYRRKCKVLLPRFWSILIFCRWRGIPPTLLSIPRVNTREVSAVL